MNRAEFLGALGRGSVTAAVAAVAIRGEIGAQPYEPCGYLAADMLGGVDVDHVTLNGERVDLVTELDDVEGWVRHLGPNFELDESGERLRTFHRTGVVRVHWSAP